MRLRATYRHPGAARYRAPGGAWDVPTLDELLTAHPVPAGAAVTDGTVRLDAAALEALVAETAGGLRAAGVRRGDVVTWQLPNWHEAFVLYRACWRCGAVAAPFHHQVGPAEVARMLEVLEPAVAFAAPGSPMAATEGVVGVRSGDPRFDALSSGPPLACGAGGNRPADIAAVLFTSGSTGLPKAVLHTHRGLAYKARVMVGVHGLTDADAVLMPAPLAHVSGLLNAVLVPGAAGMRVVLMDRWNAERGVRLVGEERVSFMIGPPTIFEAMMDVEGYADHVGSLRVISSGSMGVTPEFVDRASRRLGAVVKRTYGSTEAPSITSCTAGDPPDRARRTDGHAVGQAELAVVDPDTGTPCPPGERGEVLVRGPELFAGYADAEHTREAMHRGWFRTGDLGVLDGDGWLTIVGRLKELIIRAGENISSAEVEQVLGRHPSVRQAVVVGCPDDRLGERVAAFVVSSEPIDVAECRRWFAEQGVAKFKTPEVVVRLDEVPVLGIGKPDRGALRARAAALRVEPA